MGIYKLIEQKKREQKKKENIKIAKIATLTATIGVTIGAATGILFAPKAGKETRTELTDKTVKAKDKLAEKGLEIKVNICEKVEGSKNDLKEAKEKISEYLSCKKNKSEVESEILETKEAEIGVE